MSFFNTHIYFKRLILNLCLSGIILTCLLSGCSEKEGQDSEYVYVPSIYTSQDLYDMQQHYKYMEREPVSREMLQTKVQLSQEQKEAFLGLISETPVRYSCSEHYGIDACLEKYNGLMPYVSTHDNIFEDGSVSVDMLIDVVKKNNIKSVREENRPSDEQIRTICTYVCEVLNEYVQNNPDADLAFLSEKLAPFYIESISSFEYGSYDGVSGGMMINFDLLDNAKKLERTVKHEVFHLLQASPTKDGVEYSYGFCTKFPDEEVNALLYTWLIEGGAEQLNVNHFGSKDELYEIPLGFIETIKCATLLDSSKEYDGFESLTLTDDLSKLFEYFSASTPEQQREILEMMFAFEIIAELNFTSPAKSFFEKTADFDWFDGKYFLKGSAYATLSKQFYKNLISLDDMRLEDIFSLISIFEMKLEREMFYLNNKNYYGDFFKIYEKLQDGYFGIISESTAIETQELFRLYNDFNYNKSADASGIVCLSDKSREFYVNLLKEDEYYMDLSINEVTKWQKAHGLFFPAF